MNAMLFWAQTISGRYNEMIDWVVSGKRASGAGYLLADARDKRAQHLRCNFIIHFLAPPDFSLLIVDRALLEIYYNKQKISCVIYEQS